jgi:hypothetical protein
VETCSQDPNKGGNPDILVAIWGDFSTEAAAEIQEALVRFTQLRG